MEEEDEKAREKGEATMDVVAEEGEGKVTAERGRACPYLGETDRHRLDFDLRKVCSVTCAEEHVYCCLTCGLFLKGRGRATPAYRHAMEREHHLYIHLETCETFSLPENYRVEDKSLSDIVANLRPTFSPATIAAFDRRTQACRAIDGSVFVPGLMGINNINNCSDYISTAIRFLACVKPLRNSLLLHTPSSFSPGKNDTDVVYAALSGVIKSLFNPLSFKGTLSPHEFLYVCDNASEHRFNSANSQDAFHFLQWLLNRLQRTAQHQRRQLKNQRRNGTASRRADPYPSQPVAQTTEVRKGDVQDCLQGELSIRGRAQKFFSFTLELPSLPVFKASASDTIIPEIHLSSLLESFFAKLAADSEGEPAFRPAATAGQQGTGSTHRGEGGADQGESVRTAERSGLDRGLENKEEIEDSGLSHALNRGVQAHIKDANVPERGVQLEGIEKLDGLVGSVPSVLLTQAPEYLILHINRIQRDKYSTEKNLTIVKTPLERFRLRDFVHLEEKNGGREREGEGGAEGEGEREGEGDEDRDYDLITSIIDTGPIGAAKYTIQILHEASGDWYEIRDLFVKKLLPQQVLISTPNILLYRRRSSAGAAPTRRNSEKKRQ